VQGHDSKALAALMQHAPLPMAHLVGAALVVNAINPAFCRALGSASKALLGKPFADLFTQSNRALALFARVLATGQSEAFAVANGEASNVVYSAFTCWTVSEKASAEPALMVQVTETNALQQQSAAINEALLMRSIALHESKSEADRFNVRLQTEIAERKQAEALLRQTRDTFVLLVENAPYGLYIVDADFRLAQVSREAKNTFAGIDPLIGRDFAEVVRIVWPEPYASEAIAHFRETLASGEPYIANIVSEQRRNVDLMQAYAWRIARLVLPDGKLGVVCYFYDVSEQEAAQQLLRDADQRKTEFLATLAHELRNPLAPLRSGLELLAISSNDPQVFAHAHDMMSRQLDQMVRLIDDLMDLSRISRGVVELRTEIVDLRLVLEQVVESCRPEFDRQHHVLVLRSMPKPMLVNGDAVRLGQVFSNLLNNAAKYTDQGGAISVVAEAGAEDFSVVVTDNGIGISSDQLDRVFDMFAQVTRSHGRILSGLGIGLNSVKHLVQMHGGRITVASPGLKAGSSFTVHLPFADASAAAEVQIVASSPPPSSALRVLVVDDNEDAASMMALLLGKLGHTVRIAHNGEEAIDVGTQMSPNIVMMDIGMPIMNGLEACRAIRKLPWGKTATMVAVSGLGQPADQRKSDEAGFDLHLVKPIASAELQAVFAEHTLAEGVAGKYAEVIC
jgi:signal transduction histidine kinase/ActR/RegA family two-component response regulator